MAKWEEAVRNDQPGWIVMTPTIEEISTGGQKYLPQPDGSFLAQGYAPTKHSVHFEVKLQGKDVTAFQLELLTDPNLPRGGPGRSIEGTGALTEFQVQYAPADGPAKKRKVK